MNDALTLDHLTQSADANLQAAQEIDADLIVPGCEYKSAWTAALTGSVSDMVSPVSSIDLLFVR